jgi:hypothetical protein
MTSVQPDKAAEMGQQLLEATHGRTDLRLNREIYRDTTYRPTYNIQLQRYNILEVAGHICAIHRHDHLCLIKACVWDLWVATCSQKQASQPCSTENVTLP